MPTWRLENRNFRETGYGVAMLSLLPLFFLPTDLPPLILKLFSRVIEPFRVRLPVSFDSFSQPMWFTW